MSLNEHLDRMAAFEPVPFPVISLYLNTQADQHGRDNFDSFVRKELSARVTFVENPELLADVGGIGAFLRYRT
jgi:hypothetical protein